VILQEPETPPPATLEEVAAVPLTPPSLGKPIPQDLRVGLIGAGRVVHNSVLPAYRQAGITPVAASDPDPEARSAVQRRWGVERVFADFRDMLDAVNLDVVDVNIRWDVGLSPTRVAAVEEAARRGIHVLMAKPFAATYAQCRAMVDAAHAGGITLAVDHNTRFAPVPHGIRSLIQAGVTGPLISASYLYHSAVGRQHTNAFDAAYDNVVHAADTLLTWFEQEPEEVYAHWSRRVDGVGSVLSGTLRFADGANATILFDFATRHRRQMDFVAVGERASVDGRQDAGAPPPATMRRPALRYGPHTPRGLVVELPLRHSLMPDSFLASRADFLQAIREGREPWVSSAQVLRTMRTHIALCRSAAEGRPVRPASIDDSA